MASYNAESAAEYGNAHQLSANGNGNGSALDLSEKPHIEPKEEHLDTIAARGHAATDQYGTL